MRLLPRKLFRSPHRRRRRKNRFSWWMLFGVIIIAAALIDAYILSSQLDVKPATEVAKIVATPSPIVIPSSSLPPTAAATIAPAAIPLPASASVTMSFTSQAPFGDWDALHEDACEEASLIMVRHFATKSPLLSKEAVDEEIKAVVASGQAIGQEPSITIEQLNQLAQKHYSWKTGRVVTGSNVTVEAIKKELASNRPVIIPAAGKILPNPNFRGGGPVYHMLVLKGYDEQGFISNDPGTRNGEGFRYTYDALYKAIHDWDAANIMQGQKAYLVFDS